MVQVGGQEDFIFTDETVYGDGGDFSVTKFRLGQNQKLTNPNFSNNYRNIMGGDMKPVRRVVGEKNYRATLEFTVDSWRFLKYLTNLESESGSAGVFTHELDIPTNDFNGGGTFAFQRKLDDGNVYLHTGVKPISITINFQKGTDEQGFLRISMPVIIQDITKVSSGNIETLAESTRDVYQFNTCKLTTSNYEIVEINSGSYVMDWNVNPDDSRYCNATLKELIGEPIYANLTEELNVNINTLNPDFIDEFLNRQELSGTNKVEFIQDDTNNKVEFNFGKLYNEGNLPPTQFGEVTKTDILYVPIINNIVVTDDIENY